MRYFEWDDQKAASNEVKHGVRFADATRAFDDTYVLTEGDRVVDSEERWRTIGLVGSRLLFVAHTVREERFDEVIRIISARKATKAERRRYGQNHKKNDG